jgi:hypothetical protein
MIDAYTNLFKKYDKDLFFKEGIEEIIYVNENQIDKNWKSLIEKLNNNEKLFIRGYGRDSVGTRAYFILYKHLFKNENIRKDSTNNIEPTKLISNLTGYSKTLKTDSYNKIRIQNYQVSHLFGRTKNPLLFTAAWNIAFIPKYIDPFTGHETQGEYNQAFKVLFKELITSRFIKYINEYNDFVEEFIDPYLEVAFELTNLDLKDSGINFNKFKSDAINELSKIPIL